MHLKMDYYKQVIRYQRCYYFLPKSLMIDLRAEVTILPSTHAFQVATTDILGMKQHTDVRDNEYVKRMILVQRKFMRYHCRIVY